jgi:hypothetical protein
MFGKPNPHFRWGDSANLLLALAVAIVMMLLFLRMVIFVAGPNNPS